MPTLPTLPIAQTTPDPFEFRDITIYDQPGRPWHEHVARAVSRGRLETLWGLIGQPGGPQKLHEGFALYGGSACYNFARVCINAGREDVLEWLLAVAPGGATIQDAITSSTQSDKSYFNAGSLHEEAILGGIAPSPRALAVALQYEPSPPALNIDAWPPYPGASMHVIALQKVVQPHGSNWKEQHAFSARAQACCRLLLQHDAPLTAAQQRNGGPASDTPGFILSRLLFQTTWHHLARGGLNDVVVPLIGDYVNAGLINGHEQVGTLGPLLSNEMTSPRTHLEHALRHGNGYAASALIALGFDTALPNYPQFHDDIVAFARMHASPTDFGWCAAQVTDALVRRRLASPRPTNETIALRGNFAPTFAPASAVDARDARPRLRAV